MQAVILAAGRGSRLHPITLNRSKAMLPILGKPIIARVVESIAANGIREFIIVISPEDNEITGYFQHESSLDVEVRFAIQPERKGAADALRCAAPLIRGEFIQSACDNLVSAEEIGHMLDLWRAEPRPNALLSLIKVAPEDIPKIGLVAFDGTWVTRIVEKPHPEEAFSNIASMPLYCFNPHILEYLPEVPLSPRGEYELQSAIQILIERRGRVRGVIVPSRLTLTTATDLLAINRHFLLSAENKPQIAAQAVGPDSHLVPPLYIEDDVAIGADCVIGPNVYIERDCKIGDKVSLQNAVVLRAAVVASGSAIDGEIIS
jgi:bifunctional UDP-N-acetylglucosamine pyrophosphorylase/glucosamine-1-phosphate N-acetyltransferase